MFKAPSADAPAYRKSGQRTEHWGLCSRVSTRGSSQSSLLVIMLWRVPGEVVDFKAAHRLKLSHLRSNETTTALLRILRVFVLPTDPLDLNENDRSCAEPPWFSACLKFRTCEHRTPRWSPQWTIEELQISVPVFANAHAFSAQRPRSHRSA